MPTTPQADSTTAATPPSVEAVLTHMLDELPDGILLLDQNWRIAYANHAARRISRLRPEDLNHKTHWEIYPETAGTDIETVYRDVMVNRVERHLEAPYEPFRLWLDIRVLPIAGGIGIHYRDITKLHSAELARRAASDRLEQALAATHDGVITLDPGFRFTYMNRRAQEMLAPCGNVMGQNLFESFPAAVYENSPYIENYHRAMNERVVTSFEAFYPEPLNLWFSVTAYPSPEGIAVFFRDITEETATTEALRAQFEEIDRSRRELETIYQGSPIGMALYEPSELRLLRINERQAEIFRLPAAQAIGKTFAELTAGVPASLPLIARAATGEKVLNHDIDGALDRCPDEYRHWNVNYSPIFAPGGSIQAIAAATIETTQQKRAEAALIQTEKLAAVGRMASSIAHEINNPLESVTNLIYIARQYSVVPEVKEFLTVADQELRRVSIIANQTLRFHKQSTLPREIACHELFSTVLSLYEGRLRNSSVIVEKRKRANQPIACFEGDVRQVLNNLVGNAIDAMPHGGRLLLRSRDATDWRTGCKGLILTVADTGTGISPQTQARIFEPFFTTKGHNGTGLGLWISANIVERHQGRLLLRSRQSQTQHGTVFSLFLPFEAMLHNPAQLIN